MREGTMPDATAPGIPLQLPAGFDLLDLHAAHPDRYPFLLETTTAARRPGTDRDEAWDLLFAFPGETLRLDPDGGLTGPGADPAQPGDFLAALDRWWHDARSHQSPPGPWPFTGGWFLFLGYELARQIEPALAATTRPRASSPDTDDAPIAFATRVPVAIVRNRGRGQAWLIAEESHRDLINAVHADLGQAIAAHRVVEPAEQAAAPLVTGIREPDPRHFRHSVEEIRRLIADGDVYQVNLARQWQAELRHDVTPADIYRRLRTANPAPFAGIASCGDWTLVSSSPERLVRWRDGQVETRPIAGTVPRGTDPAAEESLRHELLQNPKERAEHIMLIDLERNDLGRVCAPGSVAVDEFMVVETYAHVHHIVSNVRGRLRPGVTPGALIRAVFPGGTITGCPKVRCMAIIAALEPVARGPYTGSMGYLNLDGSGDLNILIRSFVARGQHLRFSAGSGIVADSDPDRELDETRAKARGLLMALGSGEGRAGQAP